MKGKKIRQINNLGIYYTEMYQYAVWSPYGVCLDDRMSLEQAVAYAQQTKDYIVKR